jgi:hypothetical protein
MNADDIAAAVTRARELIVFANGLEDAGHAETARRSRMVARDLLEACDELAAERSARVAIQAARDRCLAILARQAGEAAAGKTVHPRANPFLEEGE